ncbi:MFS transporter, putative metabolite:H+ symporter [Aphelenchoides besseyi]|nr:MFS transporter, putative metabolite:H+ symporter [Aphelenchoides besseyi]
MEFLLQYSGVTFRALRIQTIILLLVLSASQLNNVFLYEMISLDKFVIVHQNTPASFSLRSFLVPFPNSFVNEFHILNTSKLRPPFILCSINYVGIAIGISLAVLYSRRISPRTDLTLSCFGQVIVNAASALTPFFWIFVALRFLSGVLIGIILWSAYSLILDWSSVKNNSTAILHLRGFRFVGTIVEFGLLFIPHVLVVSWRRNLITQSLAFGILTCVRESPRWLRKNGRWREFVALSRHFAREIGYNGRPILDQDLQEEVTLQWPSKLNTECEVWLAISAGLNVLTSFSSPISLSYDLALLAGSQFVAYYFSLVLHSQSTISYVCITTFALISNVLCAFATLPFAQLTLHQVSRVLATLSEDLILCAIVSTFPSNSRRTNVVERRIRLLAINEITASVLSRPLAIGFLLTLKGTS